MTEKPVKIEILKYGAGAWNWIEIQSNLIELSAAAAAAAASFACSFAYSKFNIPPEFEFEIVWEIDEIYAFAWEIDMQMRWGPFNAIHESIIYLFIYLFIDGRGYRISFRLGSIRLKFLKRRQMTQTPSFAYFNRKRPESAKSAKYANQLPRQLMIIDWNNWFIDWLFTFLVFVCEKMKKSEEEKKNLHMNPASLLIDFFWFPYGLAPARLICIGGLLICIASYCD